jgi:threonine synthase
LAASFDWQLPEVIIYPTGGGTGLIGMWKAFSEMKALGWIDGPLPRMVAVQADGCAPVVKAFQAGVEATDAWENASTIAGGLRVPVTIGGRLMLTALRESGGTAVALSDNRIREAQKLLASQEGIFASLEGAATVGAVQHLVDSGWLYVDERILVFNTGSGLKHRFLLT